jgi:hypothetical protein
MSHGKICSKQPGATNDVTSAPLKARRLLVEAQDPESQPVTPTNIMTTAFKSPKFSHPHKKGKKKNQALVKPCGG